MGTGQFLVLPVVILLFPDGRLTRRWRVVLWAYVAAATVFAAAYIAITAVQMAGHPLSVDGAGQPVNESSPPAALNLPGHALFIILAVFWVSFAARQVLIWRRAEREEGQAGRDRRQQLKWLMSGSVVTVLGLAGIFGFGFSTSPVVLALDFVSFFATFALPAAMSVAILRYRLYEIDRIISRALAYAIVTGLLVGVYAGLVLLATRVLSFHTPVAVAASTLAAAALCNPLRQHVQRAVDRRFNRARYDADKTVAAFAARGARFRYDFDDFLVNNNPARNGSSLLIRKSCFDDVGGFDEGAATVLEDLDMWLRIAEIRRRPSFGQASTSWWICDCVLVRCHVTAETLILPLTTCWNRRRPSFAGCLQGSLTFVPL